MNSFFRDFEDEEDELTVYGNIYQEPAKPAPRISEAVRKENERIRANLFEERKAAERKKRIKNFTIVSVIAFLAIGGCSYAYRQHKKTKELSRLAETVYLLDSSQYERTE